MAAGTGSSVNNTGFSATGSKSRTFLFPLGAPSLPELADGCLRDAPRNELERDGNELAAGDVIGTNLWRARRTRPPLSALAVARLIPCLVASGKAQAASLPWRRPSRGNIPDRSRLGLHRLVTLPRRYLVFREGDRTSPCWTDGRGPQKPEAVSVGATRPPGRQPGTVRTGAHALRLRLQCRERALSPQADGAPCSPLMPMTCLDSGPQ